MVTPLRWHPLFSLPPSALVPLDPAIRARDEICGSVEEDGVRRKTAESLGVCQRDVRTVCKSSTFRFLGPESTARLIAITLYDGSTAVELNIYPEIATIQVPVRVIRAGRESDPNNFMRSSITAPSLAASFARGADTCLAGYSHFIPIESPELAAKLIADALRLL